MFNKLFQYSFPLLPILLLSACGTAPAPCPILPPDADRVSIISQDWHSDVAIPVTELKGSLQDIATQFPGSKMLLFGYGKKSFITALPDSTWKYVIGPFPGDGAIEVTALNTDYLEGYTPDEAITLSLPEGGAQKLSDYIRGDIANNPDGTPRIVEREDNPPIFVYAANSQYNFLHTCNGFVADALANAGISISNSRVITSQRLMERAQDSVQRCERPTEQP